MRTSQFRAIGGAGISLAVLALLLGGPAVAQDEPATEEGDQAELERVEVTGSRIRKADLEGLQPVQTLTREDIERSGLTSIGDILQELSVSGSAINTKFNSSGNFGFPPDGSGVGAGATRIDMRHLGAKRVLVLVDGVRWVNGSSGSGVGAATDLNTIPMSIVERVEILKDGASAIYGSDAIAGVVNIITRTDYTGMGAETYVGAFGEGDGETVSSNISLGTRTARSSVFLNVAHTTQQVVEAPDREISRLPVPNTGLTRGSSGTPQGRFIFFNNAGGTEGGLCPLVDTTGDGNPDTPLCDITTPRGSDFPGGVPTFGDDFIPFTNDERFNYAQFNYVLTPNERTSIFGKADYRMTDSVDFHLKALYNNRQSQNRAAPEPIFLGPGAGIGGLADRISIHETNPYNPFGQTLDAGDNFILLGRRPLEGGPRIFDQNVDTLYSSLGLSGDFFMGGNPFYWDVNAIYSRNHADQIKQGGYNIRKIAKALGPLSECQADAQCVPLNLFGGAGTITPEMLDYIGFNQHDISENTLKSYTANLSGDVATLPAGPLSIAVGAEYRELSGFFEPDGTVVSGDSNGIPAKPTSGKYDVTETYAEAHIPILADAPGVQRFDMTLAVRGFDYSTFGSDSTYKAGLQYQPVDTLLFRASVAEGFRAPAIGELFGTETRFDAVLTDPCSDYTSGGTPQQIQDNCQALGVPGTYTQVNSQISVSTGGNPNLQPETSDSMMAGLVYSPEWLLDPAWSEQFDIALTYYQHELTDAIQAVDAQTKLTQCVRNFHLDPSLCDGINRGSSGAISGFDNRLTNIGGVETSGYDVDINYASPSFAWGALSVDWYNTFVRNFDEITPDSTAPGGFRTRELAGREENDSAIPEWKSMLNTDWEYDAWTVSWTMRHITSVTEQCSDFLDGTPASLTSLGLCSDPHPSDDSQSENKLGSTTYHDLRFMYRTAGDTELTLGINNAFEKEPPTCYSCSLNGYDASTYDIPGRFYYLSASTRF